jgi:hypothetical protein
MAAPGSSFEFSDLAAPSGSRPAFNPDHVTRIVFRWTRPLRPGEVLGPNLAPDGKYVFSSDYDRLLDLYHKLKEEK